MSPETDQSAVQETEDEALFAHEMRWDGDPVERLCRELDHANTADAARVFLETVVPQIGDGLDEWLVTALGDKRAQKLIAALAHFPCPSCNKGVEPCERCSDGALAGDMICDTCIGLSLSRCDFCDGTGLATYSLFPAAMRHAVLADRAAAAIKRIQRRASEPTAILALNDPWHASQSVLDWNKLLGVLENAVVAARELPHVSHSSRGPDAGKIVRACNYAAATGIQGLRHALEDLSIAWSWRASDVNAEGRLASARAAYYDQLAHSPRFERTPLHHPFLSPKEGAARAGH